MFKGIQMKYTIKSVSSENTQELEDLLNKMSADGWDLYSLQEIETDDGFQYNCIFASDSLNSLDQKEEEDVVNIKTFKSQMEKMLSSDLSAYDSCKEVQEKIKEQRKYISKIKSQLDAQSEAPVSKSRKRLNDEMSDALKTSDDLRQSLIKTISPESLYSKIKQEKLSIHLSEEALDLVNPDLGGSLVAETVNAREKITEELGYVFPKVIFEDDDELNSYEISIRIRGLESVKCYVYPNHLMFFEKELNLTTKIKDAIYTTDEITGEKIVWVEASKTKDYWQNGLTAPEFIARLLAKTAIINVDELLDYNAVNKYIEIVTAENETLVDNIIPDFISLAELRYLLVNLIREEISVKDIVYIFEKINDFADEATKDDLLDKIRLALPRYISNKFSNESGVIQGFEFTEALYKKIFSKVTTDENLLRVDGARLEKITKMITKATKKLGIKEDEIILFAPLEVRHTLFMILSQFLPSIKILAKEEISNDYDISVLSLD